MNWLQAIPYALGILLLLVAPGYLAIRLLGIRGMAPAAAAAPLSAGVAAVCGILGGIFSFRLSLLSFSLTYLVILLIAFLLGLALKKAGYGRHLPQPTAPSPRIDARNSMGSRASFLTLLAAGAVGASIITYRYTNGFGAPEHLSQTFDDVYHLNAIKTILETGNGSSLTLGNLTPESRGFYPAAWHDLAAVVSNAFSLSIPASINILNIVVAAFVWPIGLMYFVAKATEGRLIPTALAGVLSGCFPAFPYLMVDMGVLYPYHMAVCFLPVALAALLEIVGVGRSRPHMVAPFAILLMGIAPGIVLAHPSTILAFYAFSAPFVVTRCLRIFHLRSSGRVRSTESLRLLAPLAAYLLSGLMLWIILRPPARAANWPPTREPVTALVEVLFGTPTGLNGGILMGALTIAGIVRVIQEKRARVLLWLFVTGGFLYVVVTSFPANGFRMALTGNWYNDQNRLAALLPIASAPLVILGIESLGRMCWGLCASLLAKRGSALPGPLVKRFGSVAALLILVFFLQGGGMTHEQSKLNRRFSLDSATLLSADERTLLGRLGTDVPKDDVIVANPRNGESLAYALADRHVVKPHIHGQVSPDYQYLLDHWGEAATDPKVCTLVKRHNAHYALQFGAPYVSQEKQKLPGTEDLDLRRGITLVDHEGPAKLYRATACDS